MATETSTVNGPTTPAWKRNLGRTFVAVFFALWLTGVGLFWTMVSAHNHGESTPTATHTVAFTQHGNTKYMHLLFTDVVMPAVRGPALAAKLRALRPEIALLYMSGYTDGTIISRDTIEPPGLFLQKPFTPDVLVRAVRDALDSASTRRSREWTTA